MLNQFIEAIKTEAHNQLLLGNYLVIPDNVVEAKATLSINNEIASRNIYRLQEGGNRLCVALRKIANGCEDPILVANKALAHKEPDPKKWNFIHVNTINLS